MTPHRSDQLLMLQLLVAEPHQRLERHLIAEPVFVTQLEDLGVDEPLHQTKDVGVGAALDLTHEPPLARGTLATDRGILCPTAGLHPSLDSLTGIKPTSHRHVFNTQV